jgi:hypothetical protein
MYIHHKMQHPSTSYFKVGGKFGSYLCRSCNLKVCSLESPGMVAQVSTATLFFPATYSRTVSHGNMVKFESPTICFSRLRYDQKYWFSEFREDKYTVIYIYYNYIYIYMYIYILYIYILYIFFIYYVIYIYYIHIYIYYKYIYNI